MNNKDKKVINAMLDGREIWHNKSLTMPQPKSKGIEKELEEYLRLHDVISDKRIIYLENNYSREKVIDFIQSKISQAQSLEREKVVGEVIDILERYLLSGFKEEEIIDGEIKLTFGAYKEIQSKLKSLGKPKE